MCQGFQFCLELMSKHPETVFISLQRINVAHQHFIVLTVNVSLILLNARDILVATVPSSTCVSYQITIGNHFNNCIITAART